MFSSFLKSIIKMRLLRFVFPYIIVDKIGSTSSGVLMCASQAAAQFLREPLVAAAAGRTFVVFVELALGAKGCVAHRAREVVYAPRFVQRRENIASNNLVAHITQIAKELMIMLLAVSKSLLLIMTMPMERFFTFCTDKVLKNYKNSKL